MSFIHGLNNIFSLASRKRCLDYMTKIDIPRQFVRTDISEPAEKVQTPEHSAAVLVALCDIKGTPSLLYTQRAVGLRATNGEISFLGGLAEPGETPSQTVSRETLEQIGLSTDKLEIWGQGASLPGRTDTLITPVIASVKNINDTDFSINLNEVTQVFTVPVDLLCNPVNQRYTTFRNGFVLPVFVVKQYKIWGVTALITHLFLSSILSTASYSNNSIKLPDI